MKLLRSLSGACLLLLFACNGPTAVSKADTVAAKTTEAPKEGNSVQHSVGNCKDIANEILLSSNRFKTLTKGLYDAVVKNGGSSYGIELEGSPHPKADSAGQYSPTYDFVLHETYPDRDVTIARFTFNAGKGQLYEYQIVNDSLAPVDFDKSLLVKFRNCK